MYAKYLAGSFIGLMCFTFFCCDTTKKKAPDTATTGAAVAVADYEVTEDKSSLAGYYKLEHLQEWYPERVLPPAFDYSMNLDDKTIVELSLLRNEIFARNGYLFDDAVLRGHFNQFKWYQPIFGVEGFKVQLNEQEQEFINKVLTRERALAAARYIKQGPYEMVAWDHVYNTVQFKAIDDGLKALLVKNNFAIVPAKHEQFFHVYDNNHYQYIPNFITTDIYLQVLHKHLSSVLKKTEEEKFIPLLTNLLGSLQQQTHAYYESAPDARMKQASQWTDTYLAVAHTLLTDQEAARPTDGAYRAEVDKALSAKGNKSEFLDAPMFLYAQFKPRGNYTETPELERYFRCMKWLNTAPIYIDSDERFLSAVLMAAFIKRSPENLAAFERFNRCLQFIVGEEDNLSIGKLITLLSTEEANDPSRLNNADAIKRLRTKLQRLNVDKIRPGSGTPEPAEWVERSSVLFTAGRYTFDAEVLSRLIHVLQPEPKRPFPKGLDVFAALGNAPAKNILLNDLQEAANWSAYPDSLKAVQASLARYSDWDKTLYAKTFDAIASLTTRETGMPQFMGTPAWHKKELTTGLAAWTELKHDMLLYAEQPSAAQAGEGGGPPPPQHISYVEPNVVFWEKALSLLRLQEETLTKLDLLHEDTRRNIEELKEIGEVLLTVSKKELAHETITIEEFNKLSWLGGQIEYLTFRIFGSDHLPEKERFVAVAADVYNYNGVFLEEAVGMVDEIYVIAEINGKPYLTKGAVFSHYEFTSDTPLTDEAWQQQLTSGEAPARATWMKDIVIKAGPLESKPSYSF